MFAVAAFLQGGKTGEREILVSDNKSGGGGRGKAASEREATVPRCE